MGSGTFKATSAGNGGRRAFRPDARWAFVAAAVAALALAGVLVLLLSPGSTSRYPAQDLKFGPLPSWLPKSAREPAADKPQLEVATAAKPILAEEQGYTVHAVLPGGSVDITAAGPEFPAYISSYVEKGLWPDSRLVPSTFYVTLTHVKGTIPIAADAFSVEDSQYHFITARLSMPNGRPVMASLKTGQGATIEVHTKTLEGQGAIAWSPLAGKKKTLVAWIYQLELD